MALLLEAKMHHLLKDCLKFLYGFSENCFKGYCNGCCMGLLGLLRVARGVPLKDTIRRVGAEGMRSLNHNLKP